MSDHVPEGWHAVTPRLITPDVAGLVAFVRVVFGAQGEPVSGRPVELRLGDSIVMISDGGGVRASMPAMLYVYVADADATFRSAVQAGADAVEPPCDTPWGDRRATVADRWGNVWQIATRRVARGGTRGG